MKWHLSTSQEYERQWGGTESIMQNLLMEIPVPKYQLFLFTSKAELHYIFQKRYLTTLRPKTISHLLTA